MKTKYVLITPAYNEEYLIEQAIKSVTSQTILPQKWMIVNDGSTDRTDEIIKRYEARYDFITCLRLTREDIGTYYGHRTRVVMAGYKQIEKLDFDFLGVLDADITLEPTYYEGILAEFDRDPKLGIAAGAFVYEINGHREKYLMAKLHTSGSHQVFRRECYKAIGGYVPLKYGGDDSLADIMARMHGWKTSSFDEYTAIQRRIVGTAGDKSLLLARFHQGLSEYVLGMHPLFALAKSFRRVFLEKPFLLAAMARLSGFLSGYCLVGKNRKVPDEVVSFVRKEQIKRLVSYVCRYHLP